MQNKGSRIKVALDSDIGELKAVILHRPGPEIENMTPENAERALYSDILNLAVAQNEYQQLEAVLQACATTLHVRTLLEEILQIPGVKEQLVVRICEQENALDLRDMLAGLSPAELAGQLIEGVVLVRDNLTRYLSKERFALQPLHNFFYTRDAAVAMYDEVLICPMAKAVRRREALIMESIFDYHPLLRAKTINPSGQVFFDPATTIEGGDVIVVRSDILLMGYSSRTSSQGIDFIIQRLKRKGQGKSHLLVQQLPPRPESFIHIDMVFTLLDKDCCLVYAPLIVKPNKYRTIHITMEDGKVADIREEDNLLQALAGLGMELTPIYCGGRGDTWIQEREQWHSGANFLALAPGRVVGYGRNVYTIEELSRHGFEIVTAQKAAQDMDNLPPRCAITLEGSELPRGGGGARCMTMPVQRAAVNWP